ncbi:MAG TPA: hypothetical protein VF699_14335 [Caulobacteraceae bacterium]|jgi:hypothetical protein
MRVFVRTCLLATALGLSACAHGYTEPWRAPTGAVAPEDCAVYAALAPSLGDARKFFLHPVTVPTRVPEQGFNNPDLLPGFTMAEVASLEEARKAGFEDARQIRCDWEALDLPKEAFGWRSKRSYDLAFGPVFRSTDGKLAVVDVSHNDTFSRGLRAQRYVLGREGDEWLIAGFYTLPSPKRVQVGPITLER